MEKHFIELHMVLYMRLEALRTVPFFQRLAIFPFFYNNSFNGSLICVIIKLALACFSTGLYSP